MNDFLLMVGGAFFVVVLSFLFGLCQEAAEEIKNLRGKIETLHAMYELAVKQRDYLMDEQRAQVAAMRGRMQ